MMKLRETRPKTREKKKGGVVKKEVVGNIHKEVNSKEYKY